LFLLIEWVNEWRRRLRTATEHVVMFRRLREATTMRSLTIVTILCLTSSPAFACVFDTECKPGTTCVDGSCSRDLLFFFLSAGLPELFLIHFFGEHGLPFQPALFGKRSRLGFGQVVEIAPPERAPASVRKPDDFQTRFGLLGADYTSPRLTRPLMTRSRHRALHSLLREDRLSVADRF